MRLKDADYEVRTDMNIIFMHICLLCEHIEYSIPEEQFIDNFLTELDEV